MNSDRLDAAGLLARFAALHPVAATATGIHDHDGEWDRFGAAADARVLAWVDEDLHSPHLLGFALNAPRFAPRRGTH